MKCFRKVLPLLLACALLLALCPAVMAEEADEEEKKNLK